MLIAALGHAGLEVETVDATVLIDPWLSPEGAFQASWFQYPANEHLIRPALFRPSLIAISHEHLDHLDPWFLAQVPADVPILIPRYPSPVLRRKILATGTHKIVEIAPWERFKVSPTTTIFFVSEPSPMNHDSAVVVTGDGQSLLDLNDARLAPVQFRGIRQAVGGRVDVFAVQGAGASWYPICYDYPRDQKRELARQKRYTKFGYLRRAIGVLDPGITLPIGGPPCFLDPALLIHNSEMGPDGIFPDQEQVATWLEEGGIEAVSVLLPGDTWDVSARERTPDQFWRTFSFKDRQAYLRGYAERRAETLADVRRRYRQPQSSLWPAFKAYFEGLLDLSDYFNRRIAMIVGFEVTGPAGGAWAVDFRDGRQGVRDEQGDDGGYVYRIADRWLAPILDGRVLWEDFLLSLRFRARRNPDTYNDHLLGLLKFADGRALAEVERFETSMETGERITIEADGKLYSIGRRCPHAGNDLLETGEILPGGRLRCLAHHYEFDLATGQCLTSACPPLSIQRLDG